MNNDMIEQSSDTAVAAEENCKIAHIDRKVATDKVSMLLGHLAQYANMTSIVASIEKGKQYVVQVPTKLQKGLETGAYEMLRGKKTGKTWATVAKKLPDGKKEIVGNCPIAEEAFYRGNPAQDLSSSFAMIQMQQQMTELVQMLGETYDAILRVESGQKADRIGQLNAGRDGIMHALRMKDEESKKFAIAIARGSLQEAQGKIGEVLRKMVCGFEKVPRTQTMRILRETYKRGFLNKQDDEYETMLEYYNLYMQATELIAQSFIICGENESAASVFDSCRRFMEELDFSKVKTILHSHPNKAEETLFFYDASQKITANKALCLKALEPYDYIEITVDGSEILEVLEDE